MRAVSRSRLVDVRDGWNGLDDRRGRRFQWRSPARHPLAPHGWHGRRLADGRHEPVVDGRVQRGALDWQIRGIGDFTGDENADILWQHTDGTVAIWVMSGTSVVSDDAVGFVLGGQAVEASDFDGDGRADILWRHTSGTVAVWLMNGFGLAGSGMLGTEPVGSDWTIAGVGDFDGDGMSDVLWRSTSGTVLIWLMNGLTVIGSGVAGQPDASWTIQ